MTPLCFIDTETTGVHPDRQVWEVAMIRRDDTGQHGTAFFVALDLRYADPFGLAIGRFYDRHPMGRALSQPNTETDKPPVDKQIAAERVALWTHAAHLVGAVPNFDTETLDPFLREHGLIPAWHYHLVDVENLAVGYLHGVAAGAKIPSSAPSEADLPWKSDDLSRAVGVEPPSDEERHTALGDARWAMRLYDFITNPAGR